MVHMSSLGTPKRHPESGIFWFRKRVPDRLKSLVGKSEVKLSLRTRDLGIARIKYLETSLQIERDWAQLTNPLIGAATLQFAVDQDMLSNNPAAGILVRVKDTLHERDKGFSGEEARTILAATLRRPSDKISVEMAAARRWVPWICAYTGARANEITPLTGRDFLQRDGIPMLRIRAETNKTRKFREVPISSHLVDQGLLEFANSRGARPLFYDPRRNRGGSNANPHYKKVGERLAEWVRSLGIDARVAPNHGWRHRFSSLARVLSIPEDVRNIIRTYRREGQ
jgi:integrase